MKRILFITLTCLLLIACREKDYNDPSQYIKRGETLLYCQSEYNIPSEILFYKSAQVMNITENLNGADFINYFITDVHGKMYSININEINNYVCVEIQ